MGKARARAASRRPSLATETWTVVPPRPCLCAPARARAPTACPPRPGLPPEPLRWHVAGPDPFLCPSALLTVQNYNNSAAAPPLAAHHSPKPTTHKKKTPVHSKGRSWPKLTTLQQALARSAPPRRSHSTPHILLISRPYRAPPLSSACCLSSCVGEPVMHGGIPLYYKPLSQDPCSHHPHLYHPPPSSCSGTHTSI